MVNWFLTLSDEILRAYAKDLQLPKLVWNPGILFDEGCSARDFLVPSRLLLLGGMDVRSVLALCPRYLRHRITVDVEGHGYVFVLHSSMPDTPVIDLYYLALNSHQHLRDGTPGRLLGCCEDGYLAPLQHRSYRLNKFLMNDSFKAKLVAVQVLVSLGGGGAWILVQVTVSVASLTGELLSKDATALPVALNAAMCHAQLTRIRVMTVAHCRRDVETSFLLCRRTASPRSADRVTVNVAV